MLNNIQIAFFDLDGTLTNNKKIISKENIDALKKLKDKNIKIVFCSGRWDSYIEKYNENLNLVDYIISDNGSCIKDLNSNKIIYEESLNKYLIDEIINYCSLNKLELIFNSSNKRYYNFTSINSKIYQAVIICKSKEEIDKIIKYINNNKYLKLSYISLSYYNDIKKDKYTVNINLKQTSKGNSCKYLLNYLNIPKNNSICFGDNDNDIDMFNNCGIRIAMKNGLDKLKDSADYITLSNEENGVAFFINKNL